MSHPANLRVGTGLIVYFASPRSPWMRWTNETRTGTCAGTSRRAPISIAGVATTSTQSRSHSTAVSERRSVGALPQRHLTLFYNQMEKPVLLRLVEPRLCSWLSRPAGEHSSASGADGYS